MRKRFVPTVNALESRLSLSGVTMNQKPPQSPSPLNPPLDSSDFSWIVTGTPPLEWRSASDGGTFTPDPEKYDSSQGAGGSW